MPSSKSNPITPTTTSIPELALKVVNSPLHSPAVVIPTGGVNVQVRLVAVNWLTPAYADLTGTLTIEESFDNGVTWLTSASTPFTGGTVTPPQFGQPGGLLPDLSTSLVDAPNHKGRLKLEINKDTTLGFNITVS